MLYSDYFEFKLVFLLVSPKHILTLWGVQIWMVSGKHDMV